MLFQTAAYYGYVTVNYKKLEKDFDEILDINEDGKIDMNDAKLGMKKIKEILSTNTGPTYAGMCNFSIDAQCSRLNKD